MADRIIETVWGRSTRDEYKRAQANRRADRLAEYREDVLALRRSGYDVREFRPDHFRIDGKLDLYTLHRRFHFLPTDERGGYMKARECAAEWLRRRKHILRRDSTHDPLP